MSQQDPREIARRVIADWLSEVGTYFQSSEPHEKLVQQITKAIEQERREHAEALKGMRPPLTEDQQAAKDLLLEAIGGDASVCEMLEVVRQRDALRVENERLNTKLEEIGRDREYCLRANMLNEHEDRFQIQESQIKELEEHIVALRSENEKLVAMLRGNQIPHVQELNVPGNIGCICLECIREREKERLEEHLVECLRSLRPFATYAHVLELIRSADKAMGSTNGWDNLDPILGARGQVITLGDFRCAERALSTDWAQRALGVRKIKCPDCNGEGSLCSETKRPWSECDCGWCERGTKQRIECPRCGGKASIPDPVLSAHTQSSASSASAEGSAK